jgi:hypothetical protein
MMDGASRHHIVSLIERGKKGQALAAIDGFIETYQKRIDPAATPESLADQPSPSCTL